MRVFLALTAACVIGVSGTYFAVGQTPAADPLDQPIAFLQEARRNYPAVKDYTCTLVKRERIKGQLSDEDIIMMSFRQQPFSVYMKWLSPAKFKGQEVAYVHGRNSNKMRVKSKGLLGNITDFVSIDPQDRRVFEHSRHSIYEAGIGNLIDQSLQSMEAERKIGKSKVQVGEYTYDNRRCYRIETIRPERHPSFTNYRTVLYLEKDSKLPIRTENYDWPTAGSGSEGELIESFSFVGLRFNVGLTDDLFNK